MYPSGSFTVFLSVYLSGVITVSPARKIQNVPYWCTGDVSKGYILNVFMLATTVVHFWHTSGTFWVHCKDISSTLENWEHCQEFHAFSAKL